MHLNYLKPPRPLRLSKMTCACPAPEGAALSAPSLRAHPGGWCVAHNLNTSSHTHPFLVTDTLFPMCKMGKIKRRKERAFKKFESNSQKCNNVFIISRIDSVTIPSRVPTGQPPWLISWLQISERATFTIPFNDLKIAF